MGVCSRLNEQTFRRRAALTALTLCASLAIALPARASLNWNWRYSAPGIVASGTFTTADHPDSGGFYQITAISGTRNGVAITALQPTGTPIPGNEPFAVDNLVRASGPQLTKNGFGFATASGNFANPFYADFTTPPGYWSSFRRRRLPPVSAAETARWR